MAFRIEKTVVAVLIAIVMVEACAAAESAAFPVRHTHLRKGGSGEIRIGESSISFREAGKKRNHSREWAYEDIQQLYVAADLIRLVTYEDVSWKLGKDREYVFDELPEGAAQQIVAALRGRIDERRVVAAMPEVSIHPIWQVRAKLLEGRGGSEGAVLVGDGTIVYNSAERNASRTWHFPQIDNISSSGPFDLTITVFEQGGSSFAGRHDYRFELKTELSEDRYNALWQRLNESRLSSINTQTKENAK
jgi:hypothetical protein